MPVGAEVGEPGIGVGEQVPADGEDRVADSDQGAFFAAALDDPLVAGARKVLVRVAEMAASPRAPPSQGLPSRLPPDLLDQAEIIS